MNKNDPPNAYRQDAERYIRGEGEPVERDRWETLLMEDEAAFSAYVDAMRALENELPGLSDPAALTQNIMNRLSKPQAAERRYGTGRRGLLERTGFHYALAASLTLVLVASGLFDRLTPGQTRVIAEHKRDSVSYGEQMMNATSGLLDRLINDGQSGEEN